MQDYDKLYELCIKQGYEWWETPTEVHFMQGGKIKERYPK